MVENMTVCSNSVGPETGQLELKCHLLACLAAPCVSSQRVQRVIAGCTCCVSRYQLICCACQRGHTRSSSGRVLLQPNLRLSHDSSRLMTLRHLLHPSFQCSLRRQSGAGSCFPLHSFFAVIIVGGVMRLTESGLASPSGGHHWCPPAAFTGRVGERV